MPLARSWTRAYAADEVHDEFVGPAITRGGSIADDRHAGIVADSGDAMLRRLRDTEPMAAALKAALKANPHGLPLSASPLQGVSNPK